VARCIEQPRLAHDAPKWVGHQLRCPHGREQPAIWINDERVDRIVRTGR
jgi:hypothetical protein